MTVPKQLLEWYEWRQGRRFKILSSHPGIETVQASVEYFKLHGIKTKVIGSEFRLLSEIVPLTELDAICIKRDQADGLHEYQITSSLTGPSPVALLRASQALYPPRPLSGRSGFMGTMSADTRACASYILYSSLAVLKDRMDALEKIVAHEVQEQYNLLTLDLKTLFSMSDHVKSTKDSSEAEEVCTDEELKDLWSTSRSTHYLEAFPDIFGHDSDEVF
ncbi:hypothetical protein H0H93_005600 [Arthromyces matolae]|nr:hypothetical protein H0H93_005600 [Arthromyces matolae]